MRPRGSVINKICVLYDSMSDGEQRIADVILTRQNLAFSYTTHDLARHSATSAATVSRFVRHLDFDTYSLFQEALQQDHEQSLLIEDASQALASQNIPQLLETIVQTKVLELKDTLQLLNIKELKSAIDILSKAHTISFAAVGNTIPTALSASFLFSQLGLRAFCEPTTEAMTLACLPLNDQDAIVFLSKSGHSKRLNHIMDNAQKENVPTIVITNQINPPLVKHTSCILHAATRDKTLSNKIPFSHNSMNCIIEILFLLLSRSLGKSDDHSQLIWKSLGDDKGVDAEIF